MDIPDSTLEDLFEHSPWVVEGMAWPGGTARDLHNALMSRVFSAGEEAQLRLIRAHPELAGREAASGAMTADSTGEQGRLGFTALTEAELGELAGLNAAYRRRFGFPCIVALCRHATRASVLATMRARLEADPEAERQTALGEIAAITEARLAARLGRTRGALSLHALDTVLGGGAPDLGLSLHAARGGAWERLAARRTNAQGRLDAPLLAGLDMEPGAYRIDYEVGAYHRARGVALADPAFLEIVGIGFGIADGGAHYHIPIQFTPWSYATYRGG